MLLPAGGVEGEEESLELLSASRGGQEAPCHPSVGSPLILIFDPGGLKGGNSQLSLRGSWGASEHSQHWLPVSEAPSSPRGAQVGGRVGLSEAGSCRGSPCLREVDSFLHEDQGIDENGDASSIHLFPTRVSELVGEAAAPMLGSVCPGLGTGLHKGQRTG